MNSNDTTTGIGDTSTAAGPNHIVQVVGEDEIRFSDKQGNTLSTQRLRDFFAPVGSQQNPVTTPFVLFDDSVVNGGGPAGRFVVGGVDANNLDVAVSNDADPTHGFTEMHRIYLGEAQNYFAQFPRAGFNADAYFVTFNMYTSPTGTFHHVQILTINKSTVIDADNSTLSTTSVDRKVNNFTMVPATTHGAAAGAPEWFVEEASVANTIKVVRMTNVLSATPTFAEFNLAVAAYGEPPNAPQAGGFASFPTNDSRILSTAWRGNVLVAAHTVGTGGMAHARWYQISTSGSSPVLSQSGEINPSSDVATYIPSIDIDANSDIGMTYLQSSSSTYMSMNVAERAPTDSPGTMQLADPVVRPGQAALTEEPGAARYTGITVDPSGTSFWSAGEWVPSGTALWGTWIASFSLQATAGVTHFGVTAPSGVTAGSSFSITVTALDASNNVVTNYTGSVRFSSSDGNATLPGTYTFASGDNGVHTFSDVVLRTAGNQTITVSATVNGSIAGSATISVSPGLPDHLVFGTQPTNTAANSIIFPAVTIRILDSFNNVVTGDNTDQVTLAIGNNPGGGTLSGTNPVTVHGGVATFADLSINQPGNGYTLVASSGTLTGATSAMFDVLPAGTTTIEAFEGNLSAYTVIGGKPTAQISTVAKHDGNHGLRDSQGNDWIYRNDAGAHVQQGDTITVWIELASVVNGSAYFGFGASSAGTLSVVVAPDANALQIQDNTGFTNFTVIGTSPQAYSFNHWYRLEVDWGSTGNITAKLLDSDGITVLNTVTASSTAFTSGGIAFRSVRTGDTYWDTVQRTPGMNIPLGTWALIDLQGTTHTSVTLPSASTRLVAATAVEPRKFLTPLTGLMTTANAHGTEGENRHLPARDNLGLDVWSLDRLFAAI